MKRKGQIEIEVTPAFIFGVPIFLYFGINFILNNSLVAILFSLWGFSLSLLPIKKIGKYRITKTVKEKTLYYSLFITFIVVYFVTFASQTTVIMAVTLPTCSDVGGYCTFSEICQGFAGTCYEGETSDCSECCCLGTTTTTLPKTETICDNGKDDDGDTFTDCKDFDCVGKTGPNGRICCAWDSHCESFLDCGVYYPECDINNECRCRTSCYDNAQCVSGYCCEYVVDRTKVCVGKGTVVNYGGKSYICDPPGW